MGIQKSHKNEILIEALENRFDKILCLAMGQSMLESNNLDKYMNVEEMKRFKDIYDEYKLLMNEAKEWAIEQDNADHRTLIAIQMLTGMVEKQKRQLDRIEEKIDRK